MRFINWIIGVLRGTVLSPVHTAFARGLVESVAFLVMYGVADYIMGIENANAIALVAIPMVVRTLEGVVDKIDAAKQRQRAELREAATFADMGIGELHPGDVRG